MLVKFTIWMVKIALAIGVVLFSQHVVFAKDVNGVGYDDNDYDKMVAFLNQKSAVKGKTNAKVLHWDIDSPESWVRDGELAWDDNEPKRIRYIDLREVKVAGKLDVSNLSKLRSLDVYETRIVFLNIDRCMALRSINIKDNNKLKKLNVSNNAKLKHLDCSRNNLKSVNIRKNTNLRELHCSGNKLTKLNVGTNTNLRELDCSVNKIKELNINKNTNLRRLHCSRNKLTKLNLSKNKNLNDLHCSDNKLTNLDLRKNKKLTILQCYKNKLVNLNVGSNKRLNYLICNRNMLTKLDLSKVRLSHLNCLDNRLSQITVKTGYGNKIILKAKGNGYVGLVADEINADYNWIAAQALAKSGAKFINWTQEGIIFSDNKMFYEDLDKSYNFVANFTF